MSNSISCACQKHKYAVIRNIASGLALEANNYAVTLERFLGRGTPPQLWRLEAAPEGKFFIVNKGTEEVLTILPTSSSSAKLFTRTKHGEENQRWFVNSDYTIVGAFNLAIDICQGQYIEGSSVIVFPKHGQANQQFNLQYDD